MRRPLGADCRVAAWQSGFVEMMCHGPGSLIELVVTVTVVDGARNRHLLCQDGSVERTNGRTIHHEDDYHSSDDRPRHRQEQFSRLILSLSKDMVLMMQAKRRP